MPYAEEIREDNLTSRIKDIEKQLAEAMDYIKKIADDIQESNVRDAAHWAEHIRTWKPKNPRGGISRGKK